MPRRVLTRHPWYVAISESETVATTPKESVDAQWYVFIRPRPGGQAHLPGSGTQLLPHRVRRRRLRRPGRRLVRLHLCQSRLWRCGDQALLGDPRRHYLRLRLVRTRPRQVRRPRLTRRLNPSAWRRPWETRPRQVRRPRLPSYVRAGNYYNTKESVDGQWYVFIIDENQTIIAHAPDPDLVGKHISQALGPNSYPTGSAVAASADQDGAWFDYTYANPASGVVETKHSWMVIHDGITFGSGWYERGPGKSDAPAYTRAFVQQAMNLYVALGPGGDRRLLQHQGEC